MKIKELELKLNEFIADEKLNTLEKQSLQYNLITEIETEVKKLLMPYGLNCLVISKRNHIVITDKIAYPVENAWVDIVVKFKKGTEHSRYYYTQYYYVNKIEVIAKAPNMETLTDVKRVMEETNAKLEQLKQTRINDLKNFMNSKNITFEEMSKYTELFKKYRYILQKEINKKEVE